jgi:hypothetical protein
MGLADLFWRVGLATVSIAKAEPIWELSIRSADSNFIFK